MKKRKPRNYWTIEKCQEVALKCKTIEEFRQYSRPYTLSHKNNWFNEITKHMNLIIRNHRNYWTKEKCKIEALKYNSRKEFKNKNGSAYEATRKNDWLDEICSHMIQKIKPNGYWTNKKCKIEALNFKTKKEFKTKYKGAYNASWKNDWLDEICSHMISYGNLYKRCIYVYEFENKSAYIGLTYNLKKRNKYHTSKGKVYKEIKISKFNLKQLTDYINIEDAKIKEQFFINKYKKNNWNVLNKYKGGSPGCLSFKKYTKEECQKKAYHYKNKSDFCTNERTMYSFIRKNNWLDEICLHMKKEQKWTKEKCKIEALKYKRRSDFKKYSRGAYRNSCKNKWLNDICQY